VLRALRAKVQAARALEREEAQEDEDEEELPVIGLSDTQLAEAWDVVFDESDRVYVVSGDKIEKFARRTNVDNYEAVNRLRDIMKKLGISHELRRMGAEGESLIRIGEREFTLLEQ